jgi:sulfatase maturation enzyme AslB (radical SAM superfamily)
MKTLLVVLSEKCNLNCSYCGVDKWSKLSIDPYLYLEEFRKMREQYPDEKIKIDFFGGEPLLQMDLIQTILDGVKHDNNLKLFMPTNGLLLDEKKIQFLIDNNIEVSLSFDGLWQDRNRLQLNGKKTLHRFMEMRPLFKQIPGVSCHTMITKGCYNLLENHLWIKDNFGFNPELTLVRDMGIWDQDSVDKLLAGITEMFDWYIANPHETMPYFILFYLRHFLNYHSKSVVTDNCGAGTNVFMFSENKVVPCTRFKDSPEMIAEIPKYAQMPVCQTCEVKNYCKKGCLFEQIKNQGPIVELCDIYKYVYKEVKRMTAALKHDPYFKRVVLDDLEKDQTENGYDY